MAITAPRPAAADLTGLSAGPLDSPLAGWSDPTRSGHEVVELQLLLPRWQAAALDAAARARGMTSGQILRRVIADLFSESSPAPRD